MAGNPFYRLIDEALGGDINLVVLKSKGVTEKEGKKYYIVDSIHYVWTTVYHPNLDYEAIDHNVEPLGEPLLIPRDFNNRPEKERVSYLLFFGDALPDDVLEILTTNDPRPVVIVVPPHMSEDISEEIRVRYEKYEDLSIYDLFKGERVGVGRRPIRKSLESIERLIEDAFDGEINLFILRSIGVEEKGGIECYVVDSIHFLGTYVSYQGEEGIEEILYNLEEPIYVPVNFNDLSDEDKRLHILYAKDKIPGSVLWLLGVTDPRPVVIVVPPHLSEKVSEEIQLRYEDLEDFAF